MLCACLFGRSACAQRAGLRAERCSSSSARGAAGPAGCRGVRSGDRQAPWREEYWSESLQWAVSVLRAVWAVSGVKSIGVKSHHGPCSSFRTKCCFVLQYLWNVDGMAFSGRPCGPAHSASYYVRPARGDVPLPARCFRPCSVRVVSPCPGLAGRGSLDAVRRDLAGHFCLEGNAPWQDSDRFSQAVEPADPQVAGAAGAARAASWAPRLGQAAHRTTPNAPNRFHLVRALTRFCARAGGPRVPCKDAGIYSQRQNRKQ